MSPCYFQCLFLGASFSSLLAQANEPPVVSIPRSSFEWISSSQLKVTPSCDDDGLPLNSTKSTSWELLLGSESGITIAPVDEHSAILSFTESGDYSVRFIADDGEYEASADWFVEVGSAGIQGYGGFKVTTKAYNMARQTWSDLKANNYHEGVINSTAKGFNASGFHLDEDMEVFVTLLYDGASYRNSLSWFDANQRENVYPIWSDVATGAAAPLEQGSTVSLGLLPAGTDLRFSMIQDGAGVGSELISQVASENAGGLEQVAAKFPEGSSSSRFLAFEDKLEGTQSFDDVVLQIHFVKQGVPVHQLQREESDTLMLGSDRGDRGVMQLLQDRNMASADLEVLGGVFQMPAEPMEYRVRLEDDRSAMKFSLGVCPLDVVYGLAAHSLLFRENAVAEGVVVLDDRLIYQGAEVVFRPQDHGLLGRRVFFFMIPNNTKGAFLSNAWRYTPRGNGNTTKRQPLFSVSEANPNAVDQFLVFTKSDRTVLAIEDHCRAVSGGEAGEDSDSSFDDIQIVIEPALVSTAWHSSYYGKTIDYTLGYESTDGLATDLVNYDAKAIMLNAQGSRRWDLLFSSLAQTDGQFLVDEFGDSLPISATGAISVNKDWENGLRADFFIEQQRYGADLIETGIILEDAELIGDGIRMLDWGWARQASDGSFPGTGDEVHSSSLFLEAVARGGLALKNYKSKRYGKTIRSWRRKTHMLARWFVEADDQGRDVNLEPFGHRYFLRGAALEQAARLTRDRSLDVFAEEYIVSGIANQLDDGSTLERGVFDASYHMVGMTFASRYFATARKRAVREDVSLCIWIGVTRFLQDVAVDGEVTIDPLSRTATEVSRSGAAKAFDFKHTTKGLVFAEEGLLMPGAEDRAEDILEFYNILD